MKKALKKDLVQNCRGSVMLEYVLILLVAVVFLYSAREIYSPGIGFTENIGKPMTAYFQRVLVGISLPIP